MTETVSSAQRADDAVDGELGGAGDVQASSPASPRRLGAIRDQLISLVSRYGVLIVLVVLFAVFSFLLPDTFATWANVRAMVNSQAILLILALTATLVLRTGDFDLSIAAAMALSACSTAVLATDHGQGLALAVVVALGIGLAVGLTNGLLVVYLGVDSFIVTLGMMTALTGLCQWVTGSRIIGGVPDSVTRIARDDFLSFPLVTWYGWILVVVLWYVYERTPFGRRMLFIGGSREAARLVGLRVQRTRLAVFVASSMLASLCGVLLAAQLGAMDPSIAGQYLLQPFAAAFLGATVIKVGRFNAVGTLVGLYLLVVGITGLQLLGAESWVSSVFNGTALVVAVTIARLAQRRDIADSGSEEWDDSTAQAP